MSEQRPSEELGLTGLDGYRLSLMIPEFYWPAHDKVRRFVSRYIRKGGKRPTRLAREITTCHLAMRNFDREVYGWKL